MALENFSAAVDQTVFTTQLLTDLKGRVENARTELTEEDAPIGEIEELANEGIEYLRSRTMAYEHITPVLPAVQAAREAMTAVGPLLEQVLQALGTAEVRISELATVCAEIQTD